MRRELLAASHRDYTEFNAFGKNQSTVSYDDNKTEGTCDFIAVVTRHKNGRVFAEMRGRFYEGDILEVLSPTDAFLKEVHVKDLRDAADQIQPDAKRVQEIYSFECPLELNQGDILRRRKENLEKRTKNKLLFCAVCYRIVSELQRCLSGLRSTIGNRVTGVTRPEVRILFSAPIRT